MMRLFLILFSLLLSFSCEDKEVIQDNPLDDDNPDYVPPSISFVSGPTEGETIADSDITFSWEGNDLVTEYRTKLDSGIWNNWSDVTTFIWQYLDEGVHQLSLQGRYDSGDTSDVVSVSFIVNAVQGPALIFYPRAITSSVGSNVTFQVMAEEVTNLTAAQFNISFDSSKLEVLSINQGAMLQISGESIFDVDIDNSNGLVSIITAALGGNQPSVDGNGTLLKLELKVNTAGTSTLEFDGTELFRDPDNNNITISNIVNGIIITD